MLYGIGLIASFVVGAIAMFAVSEHYYHRIESILKLNRRDDRSDRR